MRGVRRILFPCQRGSVPFFAADRSVLRSFTGGFTPATRKGHQTNHVGNKPEDADDDRYSEVDFPHEVKKVLQVIYEAIKPLEELNENFDCSFQDVDHLVVKSTRGNFEFKPDYHNSNLVVKSYITGYLNYRFEPAPRSANGVTGAGHWLSIKDGHDMRGLVTRDLLKHCAGCVQFD